jgi:hypothetical protein
VFDDSRTKYDIDKNLILLLKADSRSKQGFFSKEDILEITYHPGYITKTKEIQIQSSDDPKEFKVVIAKPHLKNELTVSTPTPQLLKVYKKDNLFIVQVPDDIKDEFESEFTIYDLTIGENQNIKVKFVKIDYSSFWVVLLYISLIFLIIISIILWIMGGNDENNIQVSVQDKSFIYSDLGKDNNTNNNNSFNNNTYNSINTRARLIDSNKNY